MAARSKLLIVGAGICALTLGRPAEAEPRFETAPLELRVAVVEDPDFPALGPELLKAALRSAADEYARRFDVAPPRLEVAGRFDIRTFLDAHVDRDDPRCAEALAARYRGTGAEELDPYRARAIAFLRKWPLDSLRGFLPEDAPPDSYEAVYEAYRARYVATVERTRALKTPTGQPLVDPAGSSDRSFAAWLCALERQGEFDVVITNTFILSDLLTEPHPHSVFGKAKIGGIAARATRRTALGGQALLATTFGIDTDIPELNELDGKPASPELRARLLGAYLLAHEIAHAVFGIPDVYDHPLGCLMTSRPGATYLDGLEELDAHPAPCPECRPYVEARSLYDRGLAALDAERAALASELFLASVKKTPKHFHGGRRRRLAQVTLASSRAQAALGKQQRALRYAKIAAKLDPRSEDARGHLADLLVPGGQAVTVSRTSSTATITGP